MGLEYKHFVCEMDGVVNKSNFRHIDLIAWITVSGPNNF